MRKLLFCLTVFLVLSLSLSSFGASQDNYLPLTEGMTWKFQHTFLDFKTQKQVAAAKSIKENLAPVALQGVKVVPQVFSFYQPADQLKQKAKSFIVEDASGCQVVAGKILYFKISLNQGGFLDTNRRRVDHQEHRGEPRRDRAGAGGDLQALSAGEKIIFP
jgi:hypothetical protein